MIYFDNAATTMTDPYVIWDIEHILKNHWYNPSSIYKEGVETRQLLESAREKIAKHINALPEEIYFTSGASESNALALNTCCETIHYSEFEHSSILENIQLLMDGTIFNPHKLESLNPKKDDLVTMMLVNNETGELFYIKEIANIAHQNSAYIHTDATQAIGHMAVDVKYLDVDYLSASGHKFGCPKGIGFLYVRRGCPIYPLIPGHQEQEVRGGTENLAYIYAMGNQLERLENNSFFTNVHSLQLKLAYELENNFKYRYKLNSNNPFINSLTIYDVDAKSLVTLLSNYDVCVSSGSACNEGLNKPSKTLIASGYSEDEAKSTIRISFWYNNTEKEIEEFIKILNKCVGMLRRD